MTQNTSQFSCFLPSGLKMVGKADEQYKIRPKCSTLLLFSPMAAHKQAVWSGKKDSGLASHKPQTKTENKVTQASLSSLMSKV